MDEEDSLAGKKIFVKLKNGMVYTGVVKEHRNRLIKLIDKFDNWIYIDEDSIERLNQEGKV